MRKTVAFLTGLLLVLGLGPVVLHPSLRALGLWLSPLLGTELYTSFMVFYLLTGDPFRYVALSLLWLGVAFICGVIVRRRLGAALTMFMVWLVMVPVLALSLFGLAMNVKGLIGGAGGPLSMIPPVPPWMTLTGLLETPIVGDTVNQLISGGLENIDPDEAMSMLRETAYRIGAAALLKPLMVVVGALLGVEAGRLMERNRDRFIPRSLARRGAVNAAIILVIVVGASVHPSAAQLIDTGDGIYVENILALSDRQGRSILLEAFAATAERRPSHANLVAHLLVSQRASLDGLLTAMNLSEGLDAASLMNLAPSTLLVTVYVDTPVDEAGPDAREMVAATSLDYGVALRYFGCFEAPYMEFNGTALPRLTVAVSYSDSGLKELAPSFLRGVEDRGGLAQAISEALSSGALTPGGSDGSPEVTLLLTGFINPGPILDILDLPAPPVELEEAFNMVKEGSLDVAVGVHVWENGVTPLDGGFTLDLRGLLGEASVTMSPSSDLSLITLATPHSGGPGDLTPNIVVTTDQPEESYVLSLYVQLLQGLGVTEVISDTTPGPASLRASTSLPLPPRVAVEKTLDSDSLGPGETLTVTVKATNQGSQAVQSLRISDTGLAKSYGRSVNVSGETEQLFASLSPGQSVSISYTATARNSGTYTLRPAVATYAYGGGTYAAVSGRYTLGPGVPGILDTLGALRRDAATLLSLVTGGRGRTATDALLAAAGLLIVLNLALSVRRLRPRARSPEPGEPPAQGPA
jgi:hypothetical protein